MVKRYATVRKQGITREAVSAYLPSNYRVIGVVEDPLYPGDSLATAVVIQGEDQAGYTLDGYVQPRLNSGLFGTQEVDLSSPIMLKVDDNFKPQEE